MAKSDGSVIIDTKIDTSGFDKGMADANRKVSAMSNSVNKLGNTIKNTFSESNTASAGKSYDQLQKEIAQTEALLDKLIEKQIRFVETGGNTKSRAFAGMEYDIEMARNKLFGLREELSKTEKIAPKSMNVLKKGVENTTKSIKKMGDSAKKSNQSILKMLATSVLFSIVFKAINTITKGFTDGINNLAQYSDETNNSLSALKSSLTQLKNSFATAFAPILTAVTPLLVKFIGLVSQAANMVSALFSALSGKSTYTKAIEVQEDYRDSLEGTADAAKKAQKYLSGLDEIRTFTDNSAGAGTGVSPKDMFEEVQIPTKITDFIEKIKNAIDGIKGKIKELTNQFPGLSNVVSIVQGSFELLKKVGIDLFNLLTKPITDNADGILLASKNIAEFVAGMVETIIIGFDGFIQELNTVYDEHIGPVFQSITQDISDLVGKFLEWFNNDMAPVLDRWGEKFDEVWADHIQPMLDNFAEFFGVIGDAVGNIWNNRIQPFLNWCVNTLLPVLTPVFENIGNAVLDMVGVIADVISVLIDILGGVITFTMGSFAGDWETAWNGILEILKGIINLLILAVQEGLNFVIGLINNMISGVNDISTAIGLGEIPLIPKLELPMLATGAVIPPNAPFMAVLGDQKHGTNIEAPLDTIKQAVREVVGNGGGGSYQFTAQINRRTLFDEFIEEAKLRQDVYGYNPFDLRGAKA